MHDAGEVLEIPTKDDAKLLKECRQALRNHINDKHNTMSSTFFETAMKLNNDMREMHTKMEAIYHSVRDAADVYHDWCHHGAAHCRDTYKFGIGIKWGEIHSAMIGLGIEDCLAEVAKSKKEQKEEADAEKKRKKWRRSKRIEGRRSKRIEGRRSKRIEELELAEENNSPTISNEESDNINSIKFSVPDSKNFHALKKHSIL